MSPFRWIVAAWLLSAAATLAQPAPNSGSGANPVSTFPAINGGQEKVWTEPKQLFVDDFGTGTINVTSRWNTPTTGGGGNATGATNAVGATVMGSGNQASGWSLLQTQKVFPDRNPGYLTFQANINLPAAGTINSYLMWGFGTAAAAPTTAQPCGTPGSGSNFVGFGFTTAGKLEAFVCASGNKTMIADLSLLQTGAPVQSAAGVGAYYGGCLCAPQQTDLTLSYKYVIEFRGDNISWYMEKPDDGTLRRVAFTTRGAQGPDVNQLPVTFLAIAGATPPTVSSTIQVNQITIGDTAGNPSSEVPAAASTALAAGWVGKPSSGALVDFQVNSTSVSVWVMVINATSLPGNATLAGCGTGGPAANCIAKWYQLGVNSTLGASWAPGPFLHLPTGIVVACSSTGPFVLTASTTCVFSGEVQ